MRRPLLLDLYCCAGGAGTGYQQAGFDIIGIDIDPQPNYPHTFHQADALQVMRDLILSDVIGEPVKLAGKFYRLSDFDAIHASPPCQAHSAITPDKTKHLDLIPDTRAALDEAGLPYVIENVQGSPVRRDLTLCGEMFSLGVIRHRYFELGGWTTTAPDHVKHRGRVRGWRHGVYYDGPYVAPYGDGGGKGSVAEWQEALGITWTSSRHELAEAIPPAYTEWIGRELLDYLESGDRAARRGVA